MDGFAFAIYASGQRRNVWNDRCISDQGKRIRTAFLSNGNVFYYDRDTSSWTQIKNIQVILSPRMVLYGEIGGKFR